VQGGEIVKKFLKKASASAAVIALLGSTAIGAADYFTPNSYTTVPNEKLNWGNGAFSVVQDSAAEVSAKSGSKYPKTYSAKLMLYDTVPIKKVQLNVVDSSYVVLCGMPFGIKMFTNGVVVVGLADIKTSAGTVNPASDAGLKIGDIITTINGKTAGANTDVENAIESCGGRPVRLTVSRGSEKIPITLNPVRSESDDLYKAGLWVRDSTAGIGTLTFYDPAGKCFAGLGHGICDSDTGQLMPLLSGDIVPVTISGITKGVRGTPGELRGYFSDRDPIGTLSANVECGVYGMMKRPIEGKAIKIAMKQDVKVGPVKICTTISGSAPQLYDARIEKIDYRESVSSKNLVLRITDQRILSQAGGIVQGMSGSPIIQNGKLVGAVTHVFVDDPTRGYGIFAENMLTESKAISARENKLAS
jgi:stage IV sporulation protein B